jgi:hypothetical protein
MTGSLEQINRGNGFDLAWHANKVAVEEERYSALVYRVDSIQAKPTLTNRNSVVSKS